MAGKHSKSYFLRLVGAFSLVVLVAFALAAWLVLLIGRDQIRQHVGRDLLLQAHLTMHQVDSHLQDRAKELESWSEIGVLDDILIRDRFYNIENLILDLKSGSGEQYRKILVLDRNSMIIAATEVDTIDMKWDGDLDYVRGSDDSRLHIGLVNEGVKDSVPGFLMGHPITPELGAGIAGWLVVELNWDPVESRLVSPEFIHASPTGKVDLLLLSEHGDVMGGNDRVVRDITGFLDREAGIVDPDAIADALERESRYLAATSVSASGISASGGGLWVLALWEKSDAYAALGPFTAAVLGSLLVGLILSLGASYVIAGYFTRGIRTLMEATDRLAGGDLAFRVDEGTDDELGRLARSFNAMGASLSDARDSQESALARWRSLVEYAPDLILTIDLDGKVVYSNRSVQGMEPELIGIDVLDLIQPENRIRVRNILDKVFRQGDAISLELPGSVRGNPPSWSHIRIGPVIRDERVVAATLISTDITERKLLEKESLNVSEGERERIGRDLHDGVGQVMTGVAMFSRSLRLKLEAKDMPEASDATKIENLMNDAVRQMRALAKGLFPMEIEAAGLREALEELASGVETMTEVTCVVAGAPTIPGISAQDAMHLYRIAQEALTNAVRHGQATRIRLELWQDENGCGLRISDDGRGLPESPGGGMGLRMMRYRAEMIGGTLKVRSAPGNGTVIQCVVEGAGRGPEAKEGEE